MLNQEMIDYIYKNPFILGQMLGYKDLTEDHNNWIIDLWLNDKDQTLQAHRNSYKTSAILVTGTIWYLLFFPETTIAIIRKSETGASAILQEITKHYLSETIRYIYKEWFDVEFILKDYNQTKLNIPTRKNITKEFNIEIFGKGTNITGSHFKKIMIDDIITEKDRYSKAERESTKNYIRELKNIKTIDGIIIATGTPWHPDDAFTILPPAKKFPIGSIKIKGFTEDKIKELQQGMTPSLYTANYLLKHIADENRLFSEIKYKKWNDSLPSYAMIDPAYKGTNTTALSLLQLQNDDIIVKGYVWRNSITDKISQIQELLKINRCLECWYEINKDEGAGSRELQKGFPMITDLREHENKIFKISFYLKKYFDKIYFDEDIQNEYIEQINYYEEGQEPDDAPDSLSSLIRQTVYFKESNGNNSAYFKDFSKEFTF